MWKIVILFVFSVSEAHEDSLFFFNCVKNPPKDDPCRKIRTLDFGIIIDRSIYRGNQSIKIHDSDPLYDRFYKFFLERILERTNFTYAQDRIRGAVIKTDSIYPNTKVVKSWTDIRVTNSDLEPPYNAQVGGNKTNLHSTMMKFLTMVNTETRYGVQKIVLGKPVKITFFICKFNE